MGFRARDFRFGWIEERGIGFRVDGLGLKFSFLVLLVLQRWCWWGFCGVLGCSALKARMLQCVGVFGGL